MNLENVNVVYSDSDGVLFRFEEEVNALGRFQVEKGFFARLAPITENILALKMLIKQGKDVRILSASPNEQADRDKLIAFEKYLPEIPREKIILCRLGEDKSKYVGDMNGALLFDDYTENLIKWKANGGLTIKILNDYDNAVGKHTDHNIEYVKTILDLF